MSGPHPDPLSNMLSKPHELDGRFEREAVAHLGGCSGKIEAAHVRYSDAAYGKRNPGLQCKPDDVWSLPLCRRHHREGPKAQHGNRERDWWLSAGYDALALCLETRAAYEASAGFQKTRPALREGV